MSNIDILAYNRQGRVYVGGNNANTNHIAVTNIMTGCILHNPTGSGKLIAVVDFGFSVTVAGTAMAELGLGIIPASSAALTTATTTTATGLARSANGLGVAGVGRVLSAFTGPTTAVVARWVGGISYAATGFAIYRLVDNIDGAICLMPGSSVCSAALTTTIAGVASFTWVEIDLP